MTVIMKDAIKPNLVQTLEGQPVLAHAGPVRQHRARQQLDHRGPRGAEARRLRRDRGGVRLRPRVPEVLRHRVPVRRVRAERRGAGDDRARHEVPRRDGLQRPRQRGPRRAAPRASTTSAPTSTSSAQYGLPCVVSINNFPTDTEAEIALIERARGRGRRRDRGREPGVRAGRRGRDRPRERGGRGVRAAQHLRLPHARPARG